MLPHVDAKRAIRSRFSVLASHSLKITFGYAIISAVWILGSDKLLLALFGSQSYAKWHIWNELFYVIAIAITFYCFISRSMSKYNSAEADLRISQNRLDYAQQIARLGIWEKNMARNELFWSDEVYRIFGVTPVEFEVTPKSFWKFVHPDDLELLKISNDDAYRGKPQNIEYRIIRPDEIERIVEQQAEAVFGESGRLVRVIGTVQDITERKQVEKALIEAESKYRSLVEEALVGVYLYQDQKLTYINPRFVDIFGYSEEEIEQMDFLDLFFPEDRPLIAENIYKQIQESLTSVHYSLRGVKKEGTVIDLEVIGTITIYNGRPAIIGTLADITERKKSEELLRKSDKLAVVGQLAAGVAHEIRNPLAAIRGFVQLMKTNGTAKQEYFGIILSELDRINSIISEFLYLAKPQSTYFQHKDLLVLVQNVISLLNTQAIMKNIIIRHCFHEENLMIHCGEDQLKQVFVNVLKNSMEAMPEGGTIEIDVMMHTEHEALIRFVDQGCGIAEERLPRLGEPFYTTKEKGTGLGLMVSYKIIEAHQGKMIFKSELGVGTTVEILLPLSLDTKTRIVNPFVENQSSKQEIG